MIAGAFKLAGGHWEWLAGFTLLAVLAASLPVLWHWQVAEPYREQGREEVMTEWTESIRIASQKNQTINAGVKQESAKVEERIIWRERAIEKEVVSAESLIQAHLDEAASDVAWFSAVRRLRDLAEAPNLDRQARSDSGSSGPGGQVQTA